MGRLDFNDAGPQQAAGARAPSLDRYSAADEFRRVVVDFGLLPGEVTASSGKIVRCQVAGDKSNQKSGWFVYYDDDLPAGAFGNWRNGDVGNWCVKAEVAMNPAEALAYRHKMDKAREAREAERARLASEAAKGALEQWDKAAVADKHPYLEAKGVSSFGLKLLGGKLLVPMQDIDGVIHGLQSIDATGDKRFSFGCEKKGRFFLLPGMNKTAICEGYATAASVHMATGWTVLVAFDAGNLKPVAEAWRKHCPQDEIIICGDDDAFTPNNPGRAAAEKAAAAISAVALLPDFTGLERGRGTDFNDLAALAGLETVRRQLENDVEYYKVYSCADILSLPRPRWRIKGVFPEMGLATIFGQSRSGKSFLALDMALAVARGVEWFGWETVPCPVLYVNLESSWGLQGRIKSWMQSICQDPPEDLRFIIDAFDLLDPLHVRGIIKAACKGGMVIIDTLNRASPGTDENSSKDMGAIIKAATEIQAATEGLVLFITHSGKDATRGVRGHSSFIAALDTAIEVERKGDSRALKLDKVKEGIDGTVHDFQLKTVVIGHDEDGGEITSCVVEPVARPEKENALKPALKYALDMFNKARGEAAGVSLEEWRQAFYSEHTGDKADTKKRAFNRARAELVELAILSVRDDFYTHKKQSWTDFND